MIPTLSAMLFVKDPVASTLCAMTSGKDPMSPTLSAVPSGETVEIMEKAVPAFSFTIPKRLLGSAGFRY